MTSMTNEELRDLIAGLAVRHAELSELQERQFQDTSALIQATDRQLQETDRQVKETSRIVQELSKKAAEEARELRRQIGGLSDKFGSFTEGMAFPSMKKLLENRFHMDVVTLRARARKNGSSMELDVLAYPNASNSKVNEVYIVEVKSHLRQEGIDQMKRILRDFQSYFPGHTGKKVYGILAAVDVNDELRAKVLQEGIYLALIHDDEFELQVPDDFQPRAF